MDYSIDSILDKCIELVRRGNELFGTNVILYRHNITMSLSGTSAGCASTKNGIYSLRFNPNAYYADQNHFMNNTIPHEVAHLIVYELIRQGRSRDRGHGRDFKRVCRALGGSGERCHTLSLTPARVHRKFSYITDSGRRVELGKVVHEKVQKGQGRRFKDTGEVIRYNHYIGEKAR